MCFTRPSFFRDEDDDEYGSDFDEEGSDTDSDEEEDAVGGSTGGALATVDRCGPAVRLCSTHIR